MRIQPPESSFAIVELPWPTNTDPSENFFVGELGFILLPVTTMTKWAEILQFASTVRVDMIAL